MTTGPVEDLRAQSRRKKEKKEREEDSCVKVEVAEKEKKTQFRSCVKVEVAVLGSPS